MVSRRSFITLSCAYLASPALLAKTSTYPNRAITVNVPVPFGGTADGMIRPLSELASSDLGQPIILQSKPGAAATIATRHVAEAAPDGYQLLLAYTSHSTNPSTRDTLPYDTDNDFMPIILLGKVPMILAVSRESGISTFDDLLEFAKSKPGGITFGASGLGGAGHLGAELMSAMGGFPMTTVAYKGGSEAVVDLMAGRIDMMFDAYTVFNTRLETGRFKVLGVASATKQPFVPDAYPIAESIPGFEAVAWWGLMAPKGTDPSIIDRLYQAYAKAWNNAVVRERLVSQGWEPSSLDPEAFSAYLDSEKKKWREVIRQIGFQQPG